MMITGLAGRGASNARGAGWAFADEGDAEFLPSFCRIKNMSSIVNIIRRFMLNNIIKF
jgi:hypothetical protein